MSQYTSDANLLRELPDGLPSTLDTEAERLPFIQQASALADALVGPAYAVDGSGQRFPDITDSPATPPVVEMATRKLAASLIFGALQVANVGTAPSPADRLGAEAVEWFRQIREGELAMTGADGTEYSSTAQVSSTTDGVEPTFRRGSYDADGALLDEHAGSLDEL